MNYEANTIQWRKGDLVIHDADDKAAKMLMRVVGFTRGGLCRTIYVDPARQSGWGTAAKSRLVNRVCVLHDPARFGIEKEAVVLPSSGAIEGGE